MKKHRSAATLIKTKRIAELLKYKHVANVYQLIKRDKNFPKAVGKYTGKNGDTCYLYDESEIIEYRKQRMTNTEQGKTERREQREAKKLRHPRIDKTMALAFISRP
ncbi:MAG: hypothetical protein IBX56_03390 [Methylomicrobium sp.]|nr:hypothetical protein [Methylomicrobium sp.]